jgi:hypothetical protein
VAIPFPRGGKSECIFLVQLLHKCFTAVPIPYINLKYHTIYHLLFLVLTSRLRVYFMRPECHYLPYLLCIQISPVLLPISVMSASSGSPTYINSYIKSTQTEPCHIVTCQFRQWNSSARMLTHSPSYIQYITRNKGYIYEQYNFIKFILLFLWKNQNKSHYQSKTTIYS